jgi:hypothetical protein
MLPLTVACPALTWQTPLTITPDGYEPDNTPGLLKLPLHVNGPAAVVSGGTAKARPSAIAAGKMKLGVRRERCMHAAYPRASFP